MKNESVIILAEDDAGHAGLILKSLKDAGITNDILCFENGEDTLNFLLQRGSNLLNEERTLYILLLDIQMPRIDGIEVLRQVKNDKYINNIPVIMLSVSGDPEEIKQCKELGCDNYFVKPANHDQFSNTIENLGYYIQAVILPEMSTA